MVNEVRIYVEGGGDQRSGKAAVQEGFSKFLTSLRAMARERQIRWYVIACGSRNAALDAFGIALRQHRNAFNVLLVDAEGPVSQSPWAHLQQRDGWSKSDISEDNCHLMVQLMEAWIIADPSALKGFYGQGFNPHPIPRQEDVELVSKIDLASALNQATQNTQKGEYHKIRHGPKILALVDVNMVRSRARHCERMFTILGKKLAEA
ncbi:MAG: DUF4276 family protein [Thermodesulfobacteriota bacterium]|nr:DUF4276 family protein [Thermodesulfobacteriota bacterium]